MTDREQKKIFASNLNRFLSSLGKTQKEVADTIQVSTQTFNTWCQGKALPRMSKIQCLADYFHIRKSSLLDPVEDYAAEACFSAGNAALPAEKSMTLPLLGSISCGKPVMMSEEHSLAFPVTAGFHADFILKASGDSMINARIRDGDLVFIHSQSTLRNGEIGAIAVQDEALLKRFYYYEDQKIIILKAENPACDDLVFTGKDLKDVHILGKATAFLSIPV